MFVAAGFDEIENYDGSYLMTKSVTNMLEKAFKTHGQHA